MISSLNFSHLQPTTPKLAIHLAAKGDARGRASDRDGQEHEVEQQANVPSWAVPRSRLRLDGEVT